MLVNVVMMHSWPQVVDADAFVDDMIQQTPRAVGTGQICSDTPYDVPSDGLCLFHCVAAAYNVKLYESLVLSEKVAAAAFVKQEFIKFLTSIGEHALVDRLGVTGANGYPGLDEMNLMSNWMRGHVWVEDRVSNADAGPILCGHETSPCLFRILFMETTDGANHKSPHFQLTQSYIVPAETPPWKELSANGAYVRVNGITFPDEPKLATRSKLPGALSLEVRVGPATRPRLLSTSRISCDQCGSTLCEVNLENQRYPKAACVILAEPASVKFVHAPRWCTHCGGAGASRQPFRPVRFWCGFSETPVPGTARTFKKCIDADFLHTGLWLLNKGFGVSCDWLRRWRYRMYLQRASFQSEADVFRLMDAGVPTEARTCLSTAFVQNILWRRASQATVEQRQALVPLLQTAPVETLVAHAWHWYAPMMFARRQTQMMATGDRQEVLAIDGNAKLHRRTCGMPFADVVRCEPLCAYLVRGCARKPHGRDTLCREHARARDMPQDDAAQNHSSIVAHRLRRALHKGDDVGHLEVKVGVCGSWQPACTVDESRLANYFATKAHERGTHRRKQRLALRAQKYSGKRRRVDAFMSSWSSAGPKADGECKTHKESEEHIVAAARTAGFLTAVSQSGIILDVVELIGAESLSQRYCFLADLVARWPQLKIVVHDDACHLRIMAEGRQGDSDLGRRLAEDIAYIVDDFHSTGHVGEWCKEHCMPSLEMNKALLGDFPTGICETVNSCLSPLAHTIHHMGRWVCQLAVLEMVDVHNIKTVQAVRLQKARAEKKTRVKERAASASASVVALSPGGPAVAR